MASAASRGDLLRNIAAGLLLGITYGLYQLDKRTLLTNFFTGPGSKSRIFSLVLVVVNFKNFPFVWHYRVWQAIIRQFELSPRLFTQESGPAALFRPTITSSLSPLTECDYNLHKSNSTYFTDLDCARSHFFGALFSTGTKKLQRGKDLIYLNGKPHNGTWSVALGAVHCSFKKEIKPYESYEMWTRLLAWDRKWMYIVTHFVKKGVAKPDGYMQDDGSIKGLRAGSKAAIDPPSKAVFATAVSKYCCKLGRLTIHPEVTLDYSNLLPPKPGGWNTMNADSAQDISASSSFEKVEEKDSADVSEDDQWTWQRIVAQNEKGLEFGKNFSALDGLHDQFSADGPALGTYTDLFF